MHVSLFDFINTGDRLTFFVEDGFNVIRFEFIGFSCEEKTDNYAFNVAYW